MDKSKTIISGTAALVALVGISGLAFLSFAADSTTVANTGTGSAAVGCPMRGGFGKNLSAADKAAFEAKRTAATAAITAGDYDAWVKTLPSDAPILTKINKDNFSQFVQAHNLQDQARVIYQKLGIDGMGMGGGMGFGGRHGGMRNDADEAPAASNSASQTN